MYTPNKYSKTDTNTPLPPPTPPVTGSGKAEFYLRHILTTIGLDTSKIDNVIFTQKIKRFALIESITEGQPKGMSNISYGGQLAILRLNIWCKWYRSLSGGKPPSWLNEFIKELFFDDFHDNKQGKSTDVKRHRSANKTMNRTDADVNFRVKLSKFPTFTGKSNDWYNLNIYFDAVADASGLG